MRLCVRENFEDQIFPDILRELDINLGDWNISYGAAGLMSISRDSFYEIFLSVNSILSAASPRIGNLMIENKDFAATSSDRAVYCSRH